MRIDHVETIHLHFDYPNQAGFTSAGGATSARLTSLVSVHTDDGRSVIGSIYSYPALVEEIIGGQLAPLLADAARRAIGPHYDYMADASMRYHLELAQRIGKVLEENGVFWFEEPFEPEDVDACATLRGTIAVPLAAGENEFGVQGFRELVRAGAVDIVQPDASRCGGVSEALRVAQVASKAGLKVAPHSWSDAVAVMANAHVVASQPHALTVEIDQTGDPFVDELLGEPLQVSDGQLLLSDQPGLGIEIDATVVERYRLPNPRDAPDGHYSDVVFGKAWYRPAPAYHERS